MNEHLPEDALSEYLASQPKEQSLVANSSNHYTLFSGSWMHWNWTHDLSLNGFISQGSCAILKIEGGPLNVLDEAEAARLARDSELPCITLYNIPNQPFDGLIEDDLLSHTLTKYLETGDRDWPLLFPMVRSVIAAMDQVQLCEPSIISFILVGLSKRAWTAWLAACSGDPRIVGIAPMGFDHLNMARQLRHQRETWGAVSPMFQPYIDRELTDLALSPEGEQVTRLLDPFYKLDSWRGPTLVVGGTNDPFWQVDALTHYVDYLPQPNFASFTPNAGHTLGDKGGALDAVATFSRHVASLTLPAPPKVVWQEGDGFVKLREVPAGSCGIWFAAAESYSFLNSEWAQVGADSALNRPNEGYLACMLQYKPFSDSEARFTSPIRVFGPVGQ